MNKERERWNRAIITFIRAARDDVDVTQQELADRLGGVTQTREVALRPHELPGAAPSVRE